MADAQRSSNNAESEKDAKSKQGAKQREGAAKVTAMTVAVEASRQLTELTGRAPEAVTGVSRSDDGWRVQLEVLEVRRIPDTTDVLAAYEVDLDPDGDLVGYRRSRRYVRGRPDGNEE